MTPHAVDVYTTDGSKLAYRGQVALVGGRLERVPDASDPENADQLEMVLATTMPQGEDPEAWLTYAVTCLHNQSITVLPADGGEDYAGPARALGEYGPSKATTLIYPESHEDKVRTALARHSVGPEHVASLVGAPDDAKVYLSHRGTGDGTSHKDAVRVSVYHPHFGIVRAAGVTPKNAERDLGVTANGRHYVENVGLYLRPERQGSGMGRDMFARQVENLVKHGGFNYIRTHAAREGAPGRPYAGYYVWPLMGYDQRVEHFANSQPGQAELYSKIKAAYPHAESVLDIYDRGGKEWWKEHGGDMIFARFDLTPGSRSLEVLNKYLASKGAQPQR